MTAPVTRRSPAPTTPGSEHRRQFGDDRPVVLELQDVTKTYPASDVRLLAGLGVLDVGENRDQEAAPKAAE